MSMAAVSRGRFRGWRIVGICMFAQNVAVGIAFGSFGPLLASNEAHFEVTRTVATLGMSLVSLTMGTVAPLLGGIMTRLPVRPVMIAAAAASAGGYSGLALLPTFGLALPMYALASAFLASLVPSRW